MLRNSVQIALCGLVALTACTSTHPLLIRDKAGGVFENIKIKAEPDVSYKFNGTLSRLIDEYVTTNEFIVTIEIKEQTSSALYTATETTKDPIRMIAKIDVYDKGYTHKATKVLDAYSTYEIADELPSSAISSKNNAKDAVMQELAHATALAIKAMIENKGA